MGQEAVGRRPLGRPELPADGLWTGVELLAETGSTNADAVAAARAGAAEGLVVVAEHQSAGRGRAGRAWSAPPRAGLAVSVLLRPGTGQPPVETGRWAWLPLLAGVALAGAVTRVTGLDAWLKWPNDLLVDGAKCAGVLAEVAGDAVVVGIGLNVTQRAGELPTTGDGAPPATSLALAGARTTDRDALLAALLDHLARWYGRWRSAGGDADECGLRAAYRSRCATLGRPVRARLPGGEEVTGTAGTVDPDGRLVLATTVGARTLAAGDVVHLLDPVRPAGCAGGGQPLRWRRGFSGEHPHGG
ncbi:MAG: biotin--[acetyl-CoA-carboxylase] ligase [Micromonosporaceae bacterium]|nr:biotin--[acetyl-CoA-carboxylase] ligase [Micromonosporaceae bacterium]